MAYTKGHVFPFVSKPVSQLSRLGNPWSLVPNVDQPDCYGLFQETNERWNGKPTWQGEEFSCQSLSSVGRIQRAADGPLCSVPLALGKERLCLRSQLNLPAACVAYAESGIASPEYTEIDRFVRPQDLLCGSRFWSAMIHPGDRPTLGSSPKTSALRRVYVFGQDIWETAQAREGCTSGSQVSEPCSVREPLEAYIRADQCCTGGRVGTLIPGPGGFPSLILVHQSDAMKAPPEQWNVTQWQLNAKGTVRANHHTFTSPPTAFSCCHPGLLVGLNNGRLAYLEAGKEPRLYDCPCSMESPVHKIISEPGSPLCLVHYQSGKLCAFTPSTALTPLDYRGKAPRAVYMRLGVCIFDTLDGIQALVVDNTKAPVMHGVALDI